MPNPQLIPALKIGGHTRHLPETNSPHSELYIRDETLDDGVNAMVTEWRPTHEQLNQLCAGDSIYLSILGDIPPPIALAVAAPSCFEDRDSEVVIG